MMVIYTWAEIEAYNLMMRGRSITTADNTRRQTTEACDYIIGLAERIKSSRAEAAMQSAAQAAAKF